MAFSGLDIYKLLPKTNCRDCGFATCLAFAMQLAKKAAGIDKCPHISSQSKEILEASSQPPIKLVAIGVSENKIEIGNESVMFRHEEKFHRPCGIGFIIDDSLEPAQIRQRLGEINQFSYERVGQKIEVNLVAIRQNSDAKRFLEVLKLAVSLTSLNLALMPKDAEGLKVALPACKDRKPLICGINSANISEFAALAKEFSLPVVASAQSLDSLAELTASLTSRGIQEIILDTGPKAIAEKINDFTQIRRQALKKARRALGYPILAIAENKCPYEEAIEAATYVAKYAGLILISNVLSYEALALLTLRQNIYTDPQKPLQIEPKLYAVGQVSDKSPVLVTTNFSLSYYTVLGEVEASRVPAYIASIDTEGMSVLTAWAAEKFTPEKISVSLDKFGVKDVVRHKDLVIPGYVAVMSGDLEERSGRRVIVGPKEASGIPSFLKSL